ncbi:MAG: PAS domain S-box protein [Salinivirgaceae bacterium]|nr:PAS domain S-box protein [Salinivirgaceae bacterium]MDD4746012.1 PAS domain S-box protein [Salinivirgaceae bacterium]
MNIAEKLKLNIRGRLMLYVLSSATLIYALSISYLSVRSTNQSVENAKEITQALSAENAIKVAGNLDGIFHITRSLANMGASYHLLKWPHFHKVYLDAQRNIMENNDAFLSVATSWELQFIDTAYTKTHGRILSGYFRDNGVISYIEAKRNLDGDDVASNYYKMKITKKEMLVDPEYYSYTGKADELVMNANFNTPIIYRDQYIGVAGIDVDLGHFQDICNNIKLYEKSNAYILSNNGTWVSSPNSRFLGKNIATTSEQFAIKHNVLEKIQEGKPHTFIDIDSLGNEVFYAFNPVKTIGDPKPWAFVISVPINIVQAKARSFIQFAILLGIIGFLFLVSVIYLISFSISKPIRKTTEMVQDLALGNIDFHKNEFDSRCDEIGDMQRSIEILSNGLLNAVNFAKEIGSGNFESDYKKLSADDTLGQTLIEMRQSLQTAANELDKKQEEDRVHRWTTENSAKLTDIIRTSSASVKNMGYDVISFLADQVGACQGGMYILNDSEPDDIYFEMVSAVAYNRKKLIKLKIKPEEGLVGRCAYEKLTINMTDIPDGYIKIESGLGESNPTNLILLPLIADERVLGVMELVSFNPLKPHEIDLLEKVSEAIALTINSLKVAQQTSVLLRQSREQAEVLSQQEEEMRQNIEEMHANQEETQKRENELRGLVDAINSVSMIAQYDMDGTLIDINRNFLDMLGLSKDAVVGKKQGSFASQKQNRETFDNLWLDLRNGKSHEITQEIIIDGKTMWITELYTPILDTYGEPIKIFNIAIDITKSINKTNRK